MHVRTVRTGEYAPVAVRISIELRTHLESLEDTQEAYLVLSKLPACIHNSIYTRYQSMNQFRIQELVLLLLKTPVCYSLSITQ